MPNASYANKRRFFILFLVIVILLTLALRIRLLGIPIERDVGEFAYVGQQMLLGVPPYGESYSDRMPGIYAIYSVILFIFGQTQVAVHLGLLIINMMAIFFIFLSMRRLFDNLTGLLSAAFFAVLSVSRSVHGFSANSEHFVIAFAMCGIFLLLLAIDSKRLGTFFWSGFLFGISFIMKQPGLVFVFFGLVYIMLSSYKRSFDFNRKMSECIRFLFGAILPFGLACFLLMLAGVYSKFRFWSFTYVYEYLIGVAPSFNPAFFKARVLEVMGHSWIIWVAGVVGAVACLWNKKERLKWLFLIPFFLLSAYAVFPGFYFRRHYFILLLPAIASLAAVGARSVTNLFPRAKNILTPLLCIPLLAVPIYKDRDFLFQMTPDEACRATYSVNPFPESLEIASYLKSKTMEDDYIAVLGSEPQIFFYSKRRSATGHIYTYMMMETHKYAPYMQEEMISEIEANKPKFIIFVNIATSWLPRNGSDRLVFRWWRYYREKFYKLTGLVDVIPGGETIYKWGEEAIGYEPLSKYTLSIFERRQISG